MFSNWRPLLLMVGLTIGVSTGVKAQALPNGCGWKMNINGHPADLCITLLSAGEITGSMTSNGTSRPVSGFWDGAARRIMFQATLQNNPC
jgi:hypothetical protein